MLTSVDFRNSKFDSRAKNGPYLHVTAKFSPSDVGSVRAWCPQHLMQKRQEKGADGAAAAATATERKRLFTYYESLSEAVSKPKNQISLLLSAPRELLARAPNPL